MWRYILKRGGFMVVTVLCAAIIIFTILYFTPGNPAQIQLSSDATQEEIHAMEVKLGLDKPYFEQLGIFLFNAFIKFDLGDSWTYHVPVMQEMFSRLPRTVFMGLPVMILGAVIGIPMGIMAARHRGQWQDYGVLGVSMIFISLPHFWTALMLVIILALKLHLLPAYGIGGTQLPFGIGDIRYYIIPTLAGVLGGIAMNGRQARSAMLEVIRADFVTTARAKGQYEEVIVRRHMLPNALLPVITILGNGFAFIVAGATLTEKIFAIPGVGLYLLDGIMYRDYPIIRGCTLFFAVFCAVVMLLLDLVYAQLDPRIKAQYISKSRKRGLAV